MEQQQYQHGQHQNMFYGVPRYFSFDQQFDESDLGATQKPILNTDDQDSMTTFFENPDHPSVFGYAFTHDDATADQSALPGGSHWDHGGSNGNNGAHHSANPVPGQPSVFSTHGDGSINGMGAQSGLSRAGGEWGRPPQQPLMNNEDFSAASFLQGLKSQQSADGSQPMHPSNFLNGSWGSFGVPANANAGLPQFRSPSMGGHQQAYNSAGQPVVAPFNAQDMQHMQQMPWRSQMAHMPPPAQQQQQQQQQSQQQQAPARARHLSLDTNTQVNRPPSTHGDGSQSAVLPSDKPRPAPVRFGSDNSFGAHGYQGPGVHASLKQQEKVGNLLGLPLAHHAAKQRRAGDPGGRQGQENGAAGQAAQLSPTGIGALPLPHSMANIHLGNDAWAGSMQAPSQPNLDAFFPESQPRKRHKSQHEREDEAEYLPPADGAEGGSSSKRGLKASTSDDEAEGAKAASKRQKSVYNDIGGATSDQSASPAAGDDDTDVDAGGKKKSRSSKKQRENLSEVQKRQNHIQSEKKRRDVINNGYSELSKLVPYLSNGKSGLSRSESLQEIASYLEVLVTGTANVMSMLGISSLDDDPAPAADE